MPHKEDNPYKGFDDRDALLIQYCTDCGVEWEMDYEPSKCDDPQHFHDVLVRMSDGREVKAPGAD